MLTWSGTVLGKASGNGTGNPRHRHSRRRPGRGIRTRTPLRTQLIVPLAVPMALGLALGVVMAESGGPPATRITATAANTDCELIVPPNPLTAPGLATPYQLTGPGGQSPAASNCTQANPNLQAFVQATILDPATGRLWVYEPLVITVGTTPAVAPVEPSLPRNAVVNLMVGFNGNNLQLTAAQRLTLVRAKCVDGLPGSLFGQVSYCNSVPFYAAADQAFAAGQLRIPASGRSPQTGQPCPTTRSFQLVDQDPSDNVTTKYLLTAGGQTAQDSTANAALLPAATPINNGSDNALLDNFILPALGCTPFTAPDLSDAGRPGTSQTLDELSAAANQDAPIALVPENDPMTMINGSLSRPKTNLYRLGVGQPLVIGGLNQPFGDVRAGGQQADTPANFCANMLNIATPFISANQSRFTASPSPVPATGNNLFTFMAARLSASFTNLGCAAFGLHNTVSLTQNGPGVAVAAAFGLVPQTPGAPAPAAQSTPGSQATPGAQTTPAAQATPGAQATPTASSPRRSPRPRTRWTPWTPWTPWNQPSQWGNPWGDSGYGN
jgi:hypothetical protein